MEAKYPETYKTRLELCDISLSNTICWEEFFLYNTAESLVM